MQGGCIGGGLLPLLVHIFSPRKVKPCQMLNVLWRQTTRLGVEFSRDEKVGFRLVTFQQDYSWYGYPWVA